MTATNASATGDAPLITHEDLVKVLRTDIIYGKLRPRERLVEEELCDRFQAKRYAIRNALDKLEKLGLVTRRPNRGVTVNDLSNDEVEQLYQLRVILHREAIALIPSDAFTDLADRMQSIQQEFRTCIEENDFDGIPAADSRFHGELYNSCGNKYLSEAIELHWQKTLCIHSYAYGKPELSRQSAEEHDKIIAATRAGDRKRLTTLCNDHMLLSLKAYKNTRSTW